MGISKKHFLQLAFSFLSQIEALANGMLYINFQFQYQENMINYPVIPADCIETR